MYGMSYAAMNSPMTTNSANGQTLASFKAGNVSMPTLYAQSNQIPFSSRLHLGNMNQVLNDTSNTKNMMPFTTHADMQPLVQTYIQAPMQAPTNTQFLVQRMPTYTSSPLCELSTMLNNNNNNNNNIQSMNNQQTTLTSLNSADTTTDPSTEVVVHQQRYDSTASLANALFPVASKHLDTASSMMNIVNDLHVAGVHNKAIMENMCATMKDLHDAGLQNKKTVQNVIGKLSNDMKTCTNLQKNMNSLKRDNDEFHLAFQNHTSVLTHMDQGLNSLKRDNDEFHSAFQNHTSVLTHMDQGLKSLAKSHDKLITKVANLENLTLQSNTKNENLGSRFDSDKVASKSGKKNKYSVKF